MSILQMSISAGVLLIVIVLIRAVALNRLPKKMFLVLWGVALCRLLVPVSIPGRFSVYSVIGEIFKKTYPDIAVPIITAGGSGTGITDTARLAEQVNRATQTFNAAPTKVIWLLGMSALFIFFTVIYFRNHRGLRYATVIRDNDYLNEWLSENRLMRPITIMQSDRIVSPLAVGILRPRIILPKSMNMSDKQFLNYVLAHEYYHIKRHDAIWKILLLFAICIHWFNPMVWLMFVLASRDLELTCDEAVICRFGEKTKKAYAYMLIGMAEQGGMFAPLYNGFSKNATEERIVSIMKIKKVSLIGTILAIVLVSVLSIGALSAFAASEPDVLNIGRYMHESGDPNKYIEVYPDGTLQLYGFDYYEFCVANNYPDAEDPEFCQKWNDIIALRKPYFTQTSEVGDEDNKTFYVTRLFVSDDESGWGMKYIDSNTLEFDKDEVFVYSK